MADFNDSWRGGGTGRGAYTLQSRATGQIPLTVKGYLGQTADLFQVQNSAGTVMFGVGPTGDLTITGSTTIVIDEAVTGALTVGGLATFNGNTVIGNAASDTLSVLATATFNERIVATNGINASGTSYFGGTVIFNNPSFFANGTAANPSISFQDDQDTGIYRSAANTVGMALGGKGLTFTSDSNGQVTITSPVTYTGGLRTAFQFTTTNGADGGEDVVFAVGQSGAGYFFKTYALGQILGTQLALGTTVTTSLADSLRVLQATATGDHSLGVFTSGAQTAVTAATEVIGVNWNLSATKTWAAGAGPLATQREFVIQAPTYSGNAGGALTITDAYTLYVTGAPIQDGNITLTRTWGLGVNGNIGAGAGTVSLPSYSFISDPDTGMFSGGADDLRFTVGGVSKLTFSTTVAQFITQVNLAGNAGVYASSALGSRYVWATAQTNDAAAITTTPATSNTILIAEDGDINFDFAHTVQTNPTLFIHSANQSTTQWVGLTHNQTNAEYSVGVGGHSFTQAVNTGGSPNLLLVTGAAHTTLAKNTEASDIYLNLTRTVQFATVDTTFLKQRAIQVGQPTYGFVGASTITTAKTIEFLGAPLAGTNATITTGINVSLASWLGTNATDTNLDVSIPGIALGTGSVTTRSALTVSAGFAATSLGNQTANLTNIYGINAEATTFESTTNTRTVTGNVASVYIAGAPVASTNVTFSNTAYSLLVDSGAVRFDGNLFFPTVGSQIDFASADITITHAANTLTFAGATKSATTGYVFNTGLVQATAGLSTFRAVTDIVAGAVPTDAELDTAFGDPSTLPSGFIGMIDDNDAGTTCVLCWTTGTAGEWFFVSGTKAV